MTTQTLTAPAPAPRRVQVSPVTQTRAIASEWVKLSTLRSTWITLAASVVGTVAVGALASWGIESHWSHLSPGDLAQFSPITQSLTGVYLARRR